MLTAHCGHSRPTEMLQRNIQSCHLVGLDAFGSPGLRNAGEAALRANHSYPGCDIPELAPLCQKRSLHVFGTHNKLNPLVIFPQKLVRATRPQCEGDFHTCVSKNVLNIFPRYPCLDFIPVDQSDFEISVFQYVKQYRS